MSKKHTTPSSPQVVIAATEYDKLVDYCTACKDEIAAFGYVKPTDDGDFFVDEVFLVPQEVSGASVDFITDGLPFAVDKAAADDRLADLKFLWHSHVNMGVGFSAVDEDMIDKLSRFSTTPWFINAIFNKKGDTNCRIDVFNNGLNVPNISHIRGVKLDLRCEGENLGVSDERIKEIDEFVKTKKYVSKTQPKGKGVKSLPPTTPSGGTSSRSGGTGSSALISLSDVGEDELRAMILEALDMYKEAAKGNWEGAQDSTGYIHWIDPNNQFKGSCIDLDNADIEKLASFVGYDPNTVLDILLDATPGA